ncbi:flagellar hook-associated protein 2 [Terribacillus halophilus]|uniref:Flagellar hook-associated protein 2 n=1 Tax=Terribacillus halophilus TaxID=361279 RepID=A0A1G6IZV2_9BACI|nr:flagellar hook-associated protein 2 [Terribacillus halophilus]SDC12058.1 flagellar hook-associated protein 2 [Terribacillus halophilus]
MVDSVSSSSNSLRVGGLASGIDTDSLVEQLMNAERQKLYKMQQEQTKLTWQQDSYREVSTSLKSFDDMLTNMKLSTTYNQKTTTSSSDAVTATADSTASNGSYSIEVKQVATAAINVSTGRIGGDDFDPDEAIGEEFTVSFTTYDQEGTEIKYNKTFSSSDSLNDILKDITNSNAGVRASYDTQSGKVVMEKKYTGDLNEDTVNEDKSVTKNPEIDFGANNAFFSDFLKMGEETGGQNAIIKYNGALEVETSENSYSLGGVTFNFVEKTDGPVRVSVDNDVDAVYDKIKEFVDKYNEIIEDVNGRLDEKVYRDYPPLTDAQKKEMSEDEIKLWDEKAKSGLLKGDSLLQNSLFSMRSAWYSNVETGGEYTQLAQIGITTSKDYLENGKLVIDEKQLKDALREDPEGVYKLFSNSEEGKSQGILQRLEKTVDSTLDNIYKKAGKSTYTNDQFTIGKRLDDVQDRIDNFQDHLTELENRYWRQFSAMEQAISQMNQQSAYLTSSFGG